MLSRIILKVHGWRTEDRNHEVWMKESEEREKEKKRKRRIGGWNESEEDGGERTVDLEIWIPEAFFRLVFSRDRN